VDRLGTTGGVVELGDGTYRRQRIVLVDRQRVTVRAAAGASPVLDEAGLVPSDGSSGAVEIRGGSAITVQGLSITGYRTVSTAKVPIGIYVTGNASAVTLAGNHVHHLGNDNPTLGSFDINAHGIAVYGTDASKAITGLQIVGNEVDHLVLGASEAVVVNGNVDGWAITGNQVHDDNNIGIDAIGYEPTLRGAARYSDANRARNGVIAGNTVTNIISEGNPSYWEDGAWCNCADGVYIDGGRSIAVTGNVIRRADIGLEIAAENPRGSANDIAAIGNTITGSAYVGLAMGGYAPSRGDAYNILVAGNTFRGNNTLHDGSPEILLQYKVHETVITGNQVTATHADNPLLVRRVKMVGSAAQNAGVSLDGNDYGAPTPAASATFVWLGQPITGLAAWQRVSGQDANSTYTTR
ncbi:MAG: hypothetical protein ABI083_13000, partial [Lapillicoccus sp.]